MSWIVMNGLACESSLRQDQLLSVCLRNMHAGHLRASEVLRLRISDVALPGDAKLAYW